LRIRSRPLTCLRSIISNRRTSSACWLESCNWEMWRSTEAMTLLPLRYRRRSAQFSERFLRSHKVTSAFQRRCNTAIAQLCSHLYEIDESSLRMWLTNREIRAAGEIVRKPLSAVEVWGDLASWL
jgi:hypothetical protein